jgi:hypothetical protein
MTSERQREAARQNIREAQAANRSRHGEERSEAQKEAQRKATAAAAERRRNAAASRSSGSGENR